MTSFRAAAICSPNIFVFCKVSKTNNEIFAAVLSIILQFGQHSVSLVSMQISEPFYESIKATNTFIYSLSPRFRYRISIPKLSPAMYPFSISLHEHVPLKFLMTKRLGKITKIYFPIGINSKVTVVTTHQANQSQFICTRKLASCSTHLQSYANVDNATKLEKLRTVAKNKS